MSQYTTPPRYGRIITAGASVDEKQALLSGTARRAYRLD